MGAFELQSCWHALFETLYARREQGDGTQDVRPDQRLEDIEFLMSLDPPNGDGGMVADDLRRHHRQHFALSRIDLPRHDRAARLIRGKIKLAKAGARAGTQ